MWKSILILVVENGRVYWAPHFSNMQMKRRPLNSKMYFVEIKCRCFVGVKQNCWNAQYLIDGRVVVTGSSPLC